MRAKERKEKKMRQITVKPASEIKIADPQTGKEYIMRFNLAAVMMFQEIARRRRKEGILREKDSLAIVLAATINAEGEYITEDDAADLASRMDTESAASVMSEFSDSLLGAMDEDQKKTVNALVQQMMT